MSDRDATPLLAIEGLSIDYGVGDSAVHAVRSVDLALEPGRIVGLAGESGCGKSTLAYGAVRLLRAPAVITAGAVRYHGRRLAAGGAVAQADPARGGAVSRSGSAGPGSISPRDETGFDVLQASPAQLRALRWREIAIVFQSAMNALNPVLRIEDQLLDALRAHLPEPLDALRERAARTIEMVGIPRARLRSYPHELSGGMRQRVMIAMALAVEPEVVIMDEPTTGLDVIVQREILREVFALRERLGFAVLFITHDLSLLLEVADELMIMYAGEVMERAPVQEIRAGGAHPYTRGLLGSFPRLRGERRRLTGIPGAPPELRGALPGCPFRERCPHAREACTTLELALVPVGHASEHLSACPFVGREPADTPAGADADSGDTHGGARLDALDTELAAESPVAPSGELVLEAVRLSKHYGGVAAVKDVSFGLRRGAVTALVGASGSGKSTIAKLLAGQERASDGEIRLDGAPIDPAARRAFRAYKREVQMVFQDPFASLNPLHTVRYHLERALAIHRARTGLPSGEAGVRELLERVRLAPAAKYVDAYPHELSGGQRQRVCIARALAAAPRALLADEPVSMLDVSIRLEILDLIADLRTNFQLAVLYITHDIASARYFADEILVMHQGEIVERGPAEQVTQHPAHPYTRQLIGSAPDPDTFSLDADPALATDDQGGVAMS